MSIKILTISPPVFLMACASLTEEACRAGNWETIGYNDGVRGRADSYINQHRESCGEYGIAPNTTVWLQGRIQGLKQYCTPPNAYKTGLRGSELNNVCAPAQISELRLANFFGLRYYEIDREIDALDDEIKELLELLANEPDEAIRKIYIDRIGDIQKTASALQFELVKYASLP